MENQLISNDTIENRINAFTFKNCENIAVLDTIVKKFLLKHRYCYSQFTHSNFVI